VRPRRWPAWLQVLSLITLVFLAGYALVSLKTLQRGEKNPGRPTTHSAGIQGYKVLYLWLKNLGIQIQRWEKPLKNLPREGVLLIIEPEVGPAPGELKALEGWVGSGGILFLLAVRPNPYMKHFGFEVEGLSSRRPEGEKGKVWLQPGPYIRGGIQIESKGHRGLTSSLPEAVFHARDSWGNVLGVVKEGDGRVVAMADPHLFSNQSLEEGDHALLALDLILNHLGGGVVMVDEYHHGYGKATTVFGQLLGPSALAPFLQGIALLLILWAARGRRFGPARPAVDEAYRSPMEYEKAMAHLYQRGEKGKDGLMGLLRWIEDEARRLLMDRKPCLQAALQAARQKIRKDTFSEKELLEEATKLYQAMERAKAGMPRDRQEGGRSSGGAQCRKI
jgi:hypothetical protein